MNRCSRRSLLQASAVGVGLATAGCLGNLGGFGDESDVLTLERAAGPGPDEVALSASDAPIVLDFFATWCAPCVPQVDSIGIAATDRLDAHFVSITTESDGDAVAQWWDIHGGDWPAVLDPEARAQSEYSAPRLPTTLVLPPGGGPGDEVWRHVGVARADAVVDAIDRASEAGAIAPPDSNEES